MVHFLLGTCLTAPSNTVQGSQGGLYYFVDSTYRTWANAKANCESQGGTLAMPKSDGEALDIKNEILRKARCLYST